MRSLCCARIAVVVAALCSLAQTGCLSAHKQIEPVADMPKELNKASSPEYVIEPPDVVQIDMVAAIPKPPYRIQPLDALVVRALEAPPDNPVQGVYQVELEGQLNLGAFFGSVPVAGLTLAEAKKTIETYLTKFIKMPTVEVSLAQGRGLQQVRGPHLVRLDGTVGLGVYGSVRIVGLTIREAKKAVEEHLSAYFQNPEVSVDITGFNSKVYYMIYDGGGAGQQVVRLPLQGSETVLDAVSQLGGISAIGDTRRIWVTRPTPKSCTCQKLPVDWKAITECGDTQTNYQLMAGDRVFVKAYPLVTFTTRLERALAPVERIFGFTLLGTGLVRTLQNSNGTNGNNVLGN